MSLFHRVSYATDASAKETELKNVKTELKKNGYSENVIKQARKEVKNRNIGGNRNRNTRARTNEKVLSASHTSKESAKEFVKS